MHFSIFPPSLRHLAALFPLRSSSSPLSFALSIHASLLKSGTLHSPPFPSLLLSSYSSLSPPLSLSLIRSLPSPLLTPHLFSSFLSPLSHSNPALSLPFFPKLLSLSLLDPFLLSTLIKSCSSLKRVSFGKQAHAVVIVYGSASDDVVIQSSLVDMYCKCGLVDDARNVFDKMSVKNKVVWTAMVSGYASNQRAEEALELFTQMPVKNLFAWTALISGLFHSCEWVSGIRAFKEMQKEGVKLDDSFILSSVIGGASRLAGLELGKQIHSLVSKVGFQQNMIVGNSLVDMYSKCSDISSARKMFDEIPTRDVISWTTMIVNEAQHGRANQAFKLFDEMSLNRIKPNEVTFVGLIYACSHAGLVQKGRELFDSMIRDYGIKPKLQHYTCLLDLLTRSGHLSEALDIITTMPCLPDEPTWCVLLSACNKYKDLEIGIRVSHQLLELNPKDPSTYVLMSNIYALAGKWDYVTKVRNLMDELGIRKKEGGYSCIEVGKENHVFYAGEAPAGMREKVEIVNFLRKLEGEMRERGYVPDTSFVMHDLEEGEKENQLFLHSERLAVAYGLVRSVRGSVIRVLKNLRVCGDCHVFLKMVSEITRREIVVRDASRFHHFKDGKCSCGDFW
ncbi:hypothetical protein LUZ60_002107 [Juncus effusus]|nr:hypothetical protein LUZ60_002107 [Juncus effusus]